MEGRGNGGQTANETSVGSDKLCTVRALTEKSRERGAAAGAQPGEQGHLPCWCQGHGQPSPGPLLKVPLPVAQAEGFAFPQPD